MYEWGKKKGVWCFRENLQGSYMAREAGMLTEQMTEPVMWQMTVPGLSLSV